MRDLSIISRCFGISSAEFDQNVRGTTWRLGSIDPDSASNLLGWTHINDILDGFSGRREVRIVREQRALDPGRYSRGRRNGTRTLVPSAIARALRDGYSLVLDDLHDFHPAARQFADELSGELGEEVDINAYVSWRSDRCFTTHWDDHDVLVIQTQGEKTWSVFEPTRQFPLGADVVTELTPSELRLAWEGVLRPGDVLYIPRGWWHHANATGEGSVHMTCGFTSRTALDFLRFVTERACAEAYFRADLPRPGRSDPGEMQGLIDRLASILRSPSAEELVESFWRHHLRGLPLRQRSTLPSSLASQLAVPPGEVVLTAVNVPMVDLEIHTDRVAVHAGSRRWEFDPSARALLERVLQVRENSARELIEVAMAGGLSGADAAALVGELVREGLLIQVQNDPQSKAVISGLQFEEDLRHSAG